MISEAGKLLYARGAAMLAPSRLAGWRRDLEYRAAVALIQAASAADAAIVLADLSDGQRRMNAWGIAVPSDPGEEK